MSTVEKIRPTQTNILTHGKKMSRRLTPQECTSLRRNVKKIRLTSYEGRNVRRNVEKMRLLSNELRNIDMLIKTVKNCTYYGKTYVVRSTTDINLFIIQSDYKSFHNPKLLDVSYPGLSIWFQPVKGGATTGKFYRLLPDKEIPASVSSFLPLYNIRRGFVHTYCIVRQQCSEASLLTNYRLIFAYLTLPV